MLFRLLSATCICILRALIIAAVCLSGAHAQHPAQPGRVDSLGKPSAAANRTPGVAASGQGRRIALVIGNGAYQYPDNLPKLGNPAHDAEDMASALRRFGFEVIERKNQTLEAMNQSIAEFGSRIGGSDAALFFFAGHGIQVKNQNYLMPINARVESEAVVPYQGVNVNQILDEMDNAKSNVNIVILDACRNNPVSGKFRSSKSRGLASPGAVPKGTVIVYATDPGNVAADGDGRNGLFTAGLLTAFKGKDLSLDSVLTVASAEVERASQQTQTPYVNGPKTLQKNFSFHVTVEPGPAETEKTFWTSIERSSDPADFEAYLRNYPKGSYRALAENQIRRVKAKAAESAAVPAAAVTPTPPPLAGPPSAAREDAETRFWNEAKARGTRQSFEAYLRKYPAGAYVALARAELQRWEEREVALKTPEAAERRGPAPIKPERAQAGSAQNASPVERPDIKVGDRWVYRSTDLWTNEEIARVEFKVVAIRGDNMVLDRTTTASKVAADVGRSARKDADRSTWTLLDPNVNSGRRLTLAFPLEIGKTWEFEYSTKRPNGTIVIHKRSARVEAWEDVEVPAGKFRALRVVHSGRSELRAATGPFSSGNVSETLWYAPALRAIVKREFHDTVGHLRTRDQVRDELTAYDIK